MLKFSRFFPNGRLASSRLRRLVLPDAVCRSTDASSAKDSRVKSMRGKYIPVAGLVLQRVACGLLSSVAIRYHLKVKVPLSEILEERNDDCFFSVCIKLGFDLDP